MFFSRSIVLFFLSFGFSSLAFAETLVYVSGGTTASFLVFDTLPSDCTEAEIGASWGGAWAWIYAKGYRYRGVGCASNAVSKNSKTVAPSCSSGKTGVSVGSKRFSRLCISEGGSHCTGVVNGSMRESDGLYSNAYTLTGAECDPNSSDFDPLPDPTPTPDPNPTPTPDPNPTPTPDPVMPPEPSPISGCKKQCYIRDNKCVSPDGVLSYRAPSVPGRYVKDCRPQYKGNFVGIYCFVNTGGNNKVGKFFEYAQRVCQDTNDSTPDPTPSPNPSPAPGGGSIPISSIPISSAANCDPAKSVCPLHLSELANGLSRKIVDTTQAASALGDNIDSTTEAVTALGDNVDSVKESVDDVKDEAKNTTDAVSGLGEKLDEIARNTSSPNVVVNTNLKGVEEGVNDLKSSVDGMLSCNPSDPDCASSKFDPVDQLSVFSSEYIEGLFTDAQSQINEIFNAEKLKEWVDDQFKAQFDKLEQKLEAVLDVSTCKSVTLTIPDLMGQEHKVVINCDAANNLKSILYFTFLISAVYSVFDMFFGIAAPATRASRG